MKKPAALKRPAASRQVQTVAAEPLLRRRPAASDDVGLKSIKRAKVSGSNHDHGVAENASVVEYPPMSSELCPEPPTPIDPQSFAFEAQALAQPSSTGTLADPFCNEALDVADVPDGSGLWLRRCVARWALRPPFPPEAVADEGGWERYYRERALLDFRHVHLWKASGDEVDSEEMCNELSAACKHANSAGRPKRCASCGKARECVAIIAPEVRSLWYQLPENSGAIGPPIMRPFCRDSVARDCHASGTARGQYLELLESARHRVAATLASSKVENLAVLATSMQGGLYILEYWIDFEEAFPHALPRTVKLMTRLYSPTGTGASVDLFWQHHFSERRHITMKGDMHGSLHAKFRPLGDSLLQSHNLIVHDSINYSSNGGSSADELCLAELHGESAEDKDSMKIWKKFASAQAMSDLADRLLGGTHGISVRKMFGLLARAAGVACAAGEEGGWVYKGMRRLFELDGDEDSDGLEDGPEDGPAALVGLFQSEICIDVTPKSTYYLSDLQ